MGGGYVVQRKRCYLYTRVSTKMQVDGYSLDAQRESARRYAKAYDMAIVKEYTDEGKSGKNIKGRPAFTEMLDDIITGVDKVDYVLVFKLSRFGRNAADALNSLQLMQDYGVNLICIEDGINSAKEAGKLLISILSSVAELERENIKTQTMAGREQKAREGKWNGGFAPYGYELIKGELIVDESEAEVIRVIFEKFVNTTWGGGKIAKYLNDNYTKKVRKNGKLSNFTSTFVIKALDNPVYMGKIAYGRRRNEKKEGTRNEYHIVKQKEYSIYDGIHQPIVSEEIWYKAQEKRKTTAVVNEKTHSSENENLLSCILKCPRCGKSMYSNVNNKKKLKKDGTPYKTHLYYACKHRAHIDGHPCDYNTQWDQETVNKAVEEIILKLVSNDKFEEALKNRINSKLDNGELQKEMLGIQKRIRQLNIKKDRIGIQMDRLDVDDPLYDRKYDDLQERLDNLYEDIMIAEDEHTEIKKRIHTLEENKITAENIYGFLLHFDKLYALLTGLEKKMFLKAFLSEVHIFEDYQEDGRFLRCIKFRFPIPYNGGEIEEFCWDKENTVETVCLLSKLQTKQHIEVDLNLDEFDLTSAESKATYDEIKAYIMDKFGLKVSSLYIAQIKDKCGLREHENYNKAKSENNRVPQCTPEKEKAIIEALKHFQMI